MSKAPKQNRSKRTATTSLKVQERINGLKEFYSLGQEILKRDENSEKDKRGSLDVCKEIAEEFGCDLTKAFTARVFAKEYSEADVEELCRLPPQKGKKGKPLSSTHIVTLLMVRNKASRRKLQHAAADNGWSCARLRQEIKKRFPREYDFGRPPRKPDSIEGALVQMSELAVYWIHWYDDLVKGPDPKAGRVVSLKMIPESLQKSLETLTAAAKEVRQQANRKLKLLRTKK